MPRESLKKCSSYLTLSASKNTQKLQEMAVRNFSHIKKDEERDCTLTQE
jgi:hypothetical protein